MSPGAQGEDRLDGIDRRRLLASGSAIAAGAALGTLPTVSVARTRRPNGRYFRYPPFRTKAKSEQAYADRVSASQVAIVGALALNIHYGDRENGRVRDAYSGRWYWDCHRNGSKYNLGHRNPQVVGAMREAVSRIDAGSFLQLSGYRAKVAQQLVDSTDNKLAGVNFGVGGADAIEIAVHAARNHTGRRKLVSIAQVSYHGATDLCLSISGISAGQRARYLVGTADTTLVPFNDVAAMQAAITTETAAVVMEPSPAQAGFPVPLPGYLQAVKAACEANGALLIVDEVQTGLSSFGSGVWAYQAFDIVPDLLTTGKGPGRRPLPDLRDSHVAAGVEVLHRRTGRPA